MKHGYEFKEQRRDFSFRAGTCDANVFHDVVIGNEYKLPDALEPEALVVDVGCHIGSFTQACLERGARRIVALEPDPENHGRARRHLRLAIAEGLVTLLPAALTGRRRGLGNLSDYLVAGDEVNTGGAALGLVGRWVVQLPLADLMPLWRHPVGLLKLDCEGAEWDILAALRHQLPYADQVCGEYHPAAGANPAERLQQLLGECGYENIVTEPHGDSGLGLFWGRQP